MLTPIAPILAQIAEMPADAQVWPATMLFGAITALSGAITYLFREFLKQYKEMSKLILRMGEMIGKNSQLLELVEKRMESQAETSSQAARSFAHSVESCSVMRAEIQRIAEGLSAELRRWSGN